MSPPAQRPGAGTAGDEAPAPSGSLSWAVHHLVVAAAGVDAVLAAQLGLTPTDYTALKHLMTADEPLGPNQLAQLLGMSSGSANALVNRLQHRGLVSRYPHPQDRRRLVLVLSAATVTAVTEALRPLSRRMEDISASMSEADVLVVERFLRACTQAHHDHRRHEA